MSKLYLTKNENDFKEAGFTLIKEGRNHSGEKYYVYKGNKDLLEKVNVYKSEFAILDKLFFKDDSFRESTCYIKRMENELSDLKDKIFKLEKAILTLDNINLEELDMMREQVKIMHSYSDILEERIRLAKNNI